MLNKEKVSLGIAPIGWTNDDMPDLGKENTFEQTVSEMALAGFTGSEVGSHYPTDPEVLKKALDLRKMTICNQWFSSFLISRPYEETEAAFIEQCDFLKKVGAKCSYFLFILNIKLSINQSNYFVTSSTSTGIDFSTASPFIIFIAVSTAVAPIKSGF